MEERISRIKKKLQDKYYHMNDAWLDDCLDYYFSENPEANDEETLTFVTAQWQLSDLREISNEKGCLPNNLAQQKSTLLPGKYILQVERGYDIATSKYKQLEAIRKISNENVAATETEQSQPWEVKSKRMMELSLTDGIQDVKAIEYRPIGFLKDIILPGFKIMIKGPVQCRRGVILMTEVNVEDVGGEVEQLLIKNAKENVLARALGLEENPDPYNNENETPTPAGAPEDPTALFEDDFDVDLEELSELESQTQKNPNKSSNNQPTLGTSSRPQKSVESRAHNVNGPRNSMTPVNKVRSAVDLPVCFDKTVENDSIEFPDDDEDFADFKVPGIPEKTDDKSKPSTSSSNPSANYVSDDDDIIFLDEEEPSRPNSSSVDVNPTVGEGIDDDLGNVEWDDFDMEEATQKAIQESLNVAKKPQNDRKILQPVAFSRNERREVAQPINVASVFKKAAGKAESPKASKKRPLGMLTPPPSTSSKIPCNRETPKSQKPGKSIADFFKKTETPKSPAKPPPPPKLCDFIIELKKLSLTEAVITKKIWGRMEGVGKLQTQSGDWFLECTISDGTERLEVVIAPELLEKEIGYTCVDFMKKKKLRKTDPEIEKTLRIALRNADEKFKNLDALLDVEFSIHKTPKIVKITELTHEERETIRNRRKNFN